MYVRTLIICITAHRRAKGGIGHVGVRGFIPALTNRAAATEDKNFPNIGHVLIINSIFAYDKRIQMVKQSVPKIDITNV